MNWTGASMSPDTPEHENHTRTPLFDTIRPQPEHGALLRAVAGANFVWRGVLGPELGKDRCAGPDAIRDV